MENRFFFRRGEKAHLKRVAAELAPALADAFAHDKPHGVKDALAREISEAVKPAGLIERIRLRKLGMVGMGGSTDLPSGRVIMRPGFTDAEFVGHELTHAILRKTQSGFVGGFEFIPYAVQAYVARLKRMPPKDEVSNLVSYMDDFNHARTVPFMQASMPKLKRVRNYEEAQTHGINLGAIAAIADGAHGKGSGLFLISRVAAGMPLRDALDEIEESAELRRKIAAWAEKHGRLLK